MKKNFYGKAYYKNNYVRPLHVKFKIAHLYYLWLAFFCIILPAKLKRGNKVLDIGCGIGNLVWALRKLGIDAYGIEPSIAAKKFSIASKYCFYTKYKILPYKNRNFDLVYTNEVLEHIAEKELDKIVNDMFRISKDKIINIVGVSERGPMITKEPSHLTIRDEEWWEKKFNKLGFVVNTGNLFYFFPYVLPSQVNIFGIKSGYFFLTKSS